MMSERKKVLSGDAYLEELWRVYQSGPVETGATKKEIFKALVKDLIKQFESKLTELKAENERLKEECAEIQKARVRQMDLRAIEKRRAEALQKRIHESQTTYMVRENGRLRPVGVFDDHNAELVYVAIVERTKDEIGGE
jgi:DNA repair exonuclease SbcCD ATPase subunit